jgi:hypothetical protein
LAIPLKNYQSIPVEPLQGKIVLDANNYYPERDGHIAKLDRGDVTTSELVARHLPKSKIVKVFNAIQAAEIESDARPAGDPDRRALPIAGDDTEAKKLVADLLDQFGFDVVDAGTIVFGLILYLALPAYEPWYPVVLPIFGFFVFGVFSGYAVYLPELFPTHIRSTAVGFCTGSARIITSFARSSPASWSAPSAAASTG